MQNFYHIQTPYGNDGPHDLVTILRRIRAGKITRDTLLIESGSTQVVPAASIREISVFFDAGNADSVNASSKIEPVALSSALSRAWQFVCSNHIITVYAGLLMMLCLILAIVLANTLDAVLVAGVVWAFFSLLHNIYLVGALCVYRGQNMSDFLKRSIAPSLLQLAMASMTLAAMMFGGLLALLIPGIAVAVMYLFVPFLVVDKRYSMIEAMVASRILVQKAGRRYAGTLAMLVFFHFVCLVCIIPIPLTLPIFAIVLSEIYEDIINA